MSDFFDFLKNEQGKADNTILAYRRDLKVFNEFLQSRGVTDSLKCRDNDAIAYVLQLNSDNKSKATINRKISSLRTFYEFNLQRKNVEANPFAKIKSARNDKRKIEFLSVKEIEKLIQQPDNSLKGIRDKALLEFMYGTGARVTEVVKLKFSDINLKMNFVTCKDSNGESRIIPIGSYANSAIRDYIDNAYRGIKGSNEILDDDYIFINFQGKPLTRQGIWKIFKEYGSKIGIGHKITPQILRNSFAVHMIQNGADLKTLQELMGFDDMSVGMAYLSVTNVRIKDVFNRAHPRA